MHNFADEATETPATKTIQLDSKTIKAIFETTATVNDAFYSAFYQFQNGYTAGLATTFKTTSAYAYVYNKGDQAGYTFNKKVIDVMNSVLKPVPKEAEKAANFTANSYIIFSGDSQTEQVNNGNPGVYSYINPAAVSAFPNAPAYRHLKDEFQWSRIFAKSNGKRFDQYLNLGVGGSRISWAGGKGQLGFNEEASHFNMLGGVAPEWAGLAVTMMGWNNNVSALVLESDKAAFYEVFKTSTMAVIARYIIDDYAGIAFVGWDRNGNQNANGWSTTGTNGNNNGQTAQNANFTPFRLNNDPQQARYFTRLAPTQYIEFTLTGKRSAALFYETGNDGYFQPSRGATFDVYVNDVLRGSFNSNYNCPALPEDFFPQLIWLEDLPNVAKIKIINTDAQNGGLLPLLRFLAYGWVDFDNTTKMKQKMMLVGDTSGNNFRHDTEQIKRFSEAAKGAVACFQEYPVYFVPVSKGWRGYTDTQKDDVSHITDVGCKRIADAFTNNPMKPEIGESKQMIKDFYT